MHNSLSASSSDWERRRGEARTGTAVPAPVTLGRVCGVRRRGEVTAHCPTALFRPRPPPSATVRRPSSRRCCSCSAVPRRRTGRASMVPGGCRADRGESGAAGGSLPGPGRPRHVPPAPSRARRWAGSWRWSPATATPGSSQATSVPMSSGSGTSTAPLARRSSSAVDTTRSPRRFPHRWRVAGS